MELFEKKILSAVPDVLDLHDGDSVIYVCNYAGAGAFIKTVSPEFDDDPIPFWGRSC